MRGRGSEPGGDGMTDLSTKPGAADESSPGDGSAYESEADEPGDPPGPESEDAEAQETEVAEAQETEEIEAQETEEIEPSEVEEIEPAEAEGLEPIDAELAPTLPLA